MLCCCHPGEIAASWTSHFRHSHGVLRPLVCLLSLHCHLAAPEQDRLCHRHVFGRRDLDVGVLPDSDLDGGGELLDDGHVIGHGQALLLDLGESLPKQPRPHHLRSVNLPQAGTVDCFQHKLAVSALLDCGLHRHRQHRCPVFAGVVDHVVDLFGRDQRAGCIVHADERGIVRGGLQAVEHRVLPLLARIRKLHTGVRLDNAGQIVTILFCDDNRNAADALQTQKQLQTVVEDWLSVQLQKLFRSVRLHAGSNTTGKQDDCNTINISSCHFCAGQPDPSRSMPGSSPTSSDRQRKSRLSKPVSGHLAML
mmetsp:Transcript_28435/g.57757  ORF Transcript_28435/g.57757 Transcript_28435/m.57757 type:complete len:309 (-) Transcript_28435:105-1031(-)